MIISFVLDEHGNWVSATPKGKEMAHNDWVRDVAWAPSTGLDRYQSKNNTRTINFV